MMLNQQTTQVFPLDYIHNLSTLLGYAACSFLEMLYLATSVRTKLA